MRRRFDRRVVADAVLDLIRACQDRFPCQLGGGVALSGAYLGHRVTGDVDLFIQDRDEMRGFVRVLPDVVAGVGFQVEVQRDAGHLVRARVWSPDVQTELDVVHDPVDVVEAPPPPLEGVVVQSFADLRASKLTCLLSRSEPRDLVDVYYLDRAGHRPEQDLEAALRKDRGIDPGVLAWLLAQFPVEPLPMTFEPLTSDELAQFRRSDGQHRGQRAGHGSRGSGHPVRRHRRGPLPGGGARHVASAARRRHLRHHRRRCHLATARGDHRAGLPLGQRPSHQPT